MIKKRDRLLFIEVIKKEACPLSYGMSPFFGGTIFQMVRSGNYPYISISGTV
jgi:hypothetical protein